MKYKDIEVGQRVLVSYYRPGSTHFSIEQAKMAEVLEKGVAHRYMVKVAEGWGSHDEPRTTNEGVRLHVWRHNLRNPVAGGAPLEPEYEEVTIAAKILPAEGENLARWESARQSQRESADASALKEDDWKRVVRAFAVAGYEVGRAQNTNDVVISREDVARLLAALDPAAAELFDTLTMAAATFVPDKEG